MKISCIIVDDEPLARKGLAEYISEVDFLELIAQCESSLEAYKVINQQKIDLLFLDIQMPKMTGIDLLKTIREQPMIIFTTAYSEYALQGYELDVLDYLVKPISFDRFLKACNKAAEFHGIRNGQKQVAQEKASYFFIRCDSRYEKISFDDLLYIEAFENYVVLQTQTKRLITYLTFKSVEDYLPVEDFMKVHKSFIVAISKINHIAGNEIKIDDHAIPISRNLKDVVMNRIVNSRLLKR